MTTSDQQPSAEATPLSDGRPQARVRLRDREDRRAAVAHFVLTTIRYVEKNHDIQWGDDNSLALRIGSAVVRISVVGTPTNPAVRLSATVLRGVEVGEAVLRRMNEINLGLPFGAMVEQDGTIRLRFTLLADQLTVAELLLALDITMQSADRYDTLLAGEFGGRTQLADVKDVFTA